MKLKKTITSKTDNGQIKVTIEGNFPSWLTSGEQKAAVNALTEEVMRDVAAVKYAGNYLQNIKVS